MSSVRTERIYPSPAELASRDRRIARAIKSGVSMVDIKSLFRVGESTIYAACKRYDVAIPKKGPKL